MKEFCEGDDGSWGVRGESEKSLRCCLDSRPLLCVREAGREKDGGNGRLVNDCFDAAD